MEKEKVMKIIKDGTCRSFEKRSGNYFVFQYENGHIIYSESFGPDFLQASEYFHRDVKPINEGILI